MNLELKRTKIRKKYFSTLGLLLISILGIGSILMLYYLNIFEVRNLDMLYTYISKYGILIILCIFFFVTSVYVWILFFLNIIVKPKKEILYLNRIEDNELIFINKKGKKFIYEYNNLKPNCYYYVLKTHNYIYEIVGRADETWTTKEKKSYWMNFYSPIGNFEDILLLPIAYVILLIGLLSLFMSKSWHQIIFGLFFSAIPIYIIGYDLIYKIKLNRSDNNTIDDTNLLNSYDTFKNIILSISVVFICYNFIDIFLRLSDFTSKLIFSPFLCCGLCSVGYVLSKTIKNNILEKIFLKGYLVIFLLYWFAFLSYLTIAIIIPEKHYLYALYTIPFWILGFFMIYKFFVKK